jgi:hypothetical protein
MSTMAPTHSPLALSRMKYGEYSNTPMRTWPVRLIRSQVDSFLGCARAGTETAATVTAAAMAVAEATSRRRIPISLLLSAFVHLVGPIFVGSYPTLEEATRTGL